MATLVQERARFALHHVKAVAGTRDAPKFKTELKDLPARLHTGGLAQTMATCLAEGDGSVRVQIYEWLQEWLRLPPISYPVGSSLMESIVGATPGPDFDPEVKYREASEEARALAVWLKKFAEAFL